MISILSICEIITTQVCPGENNLVIHTIEFYMLQSPAFIETLWDETFLDTPEIGSMIHANVNPITKLFNEGKQ
jgi:hypothetical protein